jgi:hypothetical protein
MDRRNRSIRPFTVDAAKLIYDKLMMKIELMKNRKENNWDARRHEIATLAKLEFGFDDHSSSEDDLSLNSV